MYQLQILLGVGDDALQVEVEMVLLAGEEETTNTDSIRGIILW